MKHYAIYSVDTGIFKQVGSCPEFGVSAQIPTDPLLALLEIPERSWDYWVDVTTDPHTLMDKTPQSLTVNQTTLIADGVDECLITGVPTPCTVIWPDGQQDTIEDGEVGFSVDQPGTYVIKLTSFKHFDEEVTIEAVPTA